MIFNSIVKSSPVTKRHVERKVLQNIHPLQLFRIIQDVDKYTEFLPLCHYSKVIRKNSKDGRSFDGALIVGKPPLFYEEYTSRVTVIPETLTIQAESIASTKFDSLKSWWRLQEIVTDHHHEENNDNKNNESTGNHNDNQDGNRNDTTIRNDNPNQTQMISCDVNFEVELTVSDPMIIAVLDRVLEQVAGYQVSAFEKRCRELPVPHDLIQAAKNLKQQSSSSSSSSLPPPQ